MEKIESEKNLDHIDVIASVASGAITALSDVMLIKEISLEDAHTWGKNELEDFVEKVAKSEGFKGDDLYGAIKFMEEKHPMVSDQLINKFGGGTLHHLRDFAHHASPMGLMFSILTQFTGKGYGTDSMGKFVPYDLEEWTKPNFHEGIYLGTVEWVLHLISDVAGSKDSAADGREGSGIPGPMLSFVKMLSSVPGIRDICGKDKGEGKAISYNFSKTCTKLYDGVLLGKHDDAGKAVSSELLRFDFRTELGILKESIDNKQYLPVMINTIFVSAFYSVRRLMMEIEDKNITDLEGLNKIDISRCLPWKNPTLTNMRMISSGTFSTIDIASAGIKAYLHNKKDKSKFALEFLQNINYCGIGSLVFSANGEKITGIEKLHTSFASLVDTQEKKIAEMVPGGKDTVGVARYAASTVIAVTEAGTPVGFVSAALGVYRTIKDAQDELKEAHEDRLRIEAECEEKILILEKYQTQIEETVSEYLSNKLTVISESFDKMDRAISMEDIDLFIEGNVTLQSGLGYESFFKSKAEFDNLMESDLDFKL